MEVISYRSLYHTLQDLMHATGGGWYRMHGMSAPLRDDAELGKGHGTIVKLRAQMKQRLLAWAKVLANCPGAPMVALQRVSRPKWGGGVWEIGGDVAREAGEPKVGLGAWFYGQWWSVPLAEIDAADIANQVLDQLGIGELGECALLDQQPQDESCGQPRPAQPLQRLGHLLGRARRCL